MRLFVGLLLAGLMYGQQVDWIKQVKNKSVTDVREQGAKCNGTTDDLAAFQAANDALTDGGTIIVPEGTCRLSNTLTLTRGVHLVGVSPASSILKASDTFPSSTALVQLGNPKCLVSLHYTSVENLQLDANDIASSTALYSNCAQELSYVKGLVIINYRSYGIHWDGTGTQNSRIEDVYLGGSDQSTTQTGIYIDTTISRVSIDNVTIYANAQQTTPAIILDSAYGIALNNIHIEYHDIGIQASNGTLALLNNITGHSTITTLIQLLSLSSATITNVNQNSATTTIDDQVHSVTLTDGRVEFYAGGYGAASNVFTTADVDNIIEKLTIATSFGIYNASPKMTLASSAGHAGRLDIQQEGTNARNQFRTKTTDGLLIQTHGMTADETGGGLQLLGGGYGNDADFGAVWAGTTSDMGTYTARSATSSGLNLYDGIAAIYTDSGLTPGSTYAPTARIFVESDGEIGIGNSAPAISGTGKLHVSGNTLRPVDALRTPASAAEACNQGEMSFDADYIYVCVATNTWKRAAISTWP